MVYLLEGDRVHLYQFFLPVSLSFSITKYLHTFHIFIMCILCIRKKKKKIRNKIDNIEFIMRHTRKVKVAGANEFW